MHVLSNLNNGRDIMRRICSFKNKTVNPKLKQSPYMYKTERIITIKITCANNGLQSQEQLRYIV